MMSPANKKKALARLRRIEGQVTAIRRMVEEDTYCVDVMLQIAAARGALGKVGDLVLGSHVRTCVGEAFEGGDRGEREEKLNELLDVFARYGGIGGR